MISKQKLEVSQPSKLAMADDSKHPRSIYKYEQISQDNYKSQSYQMYNGEYTSTSHLRNDNNPNQFTIKPIANLHSNAPDLNDMNLLDSPHSIYKYEHNQSPNGTYNYGDILKFTNRVALQEHVIFVDVYCNALAMM